MHYLTIDKFYSRAGELRAEFDANFADPLRAHAGRFLWDYWHVPGEYTHLRTPAYNYFSAKLYTSFHRYLVRFGREQLGCHDISPPWLSCYIEGCRQEPHQDRPHGPLAFVYSLTPLKRKFRGGETFIQKPRTLIAPEFNRLTLFNPSLTHGVRVVKGTQDPREGRLVLHGWFVNPRPFWVGPLSITRVRRALDRGLSAMPFEILGPGFGAFRLKIGRDGRVKSAVTLTETFKHSARLKDLRPYWNEFDFGKLPGPAILTLPLRID